MSDWEESQTGRGKVCLGWRVRVGRQSQTGMKVRVGAKSDWRKVRLGWKVRVGRRSQTADSVRYRGIDSY
jgi:hypothetical protein